ncbi:MAG TPA: ferritin-like domain-containing protein [Polymorphobacter sp.]|nr:ferritin-like domain-containing protein [Polymorphobacter sp.]
MTTLPASAPATTGAAFAHINAVTAPTIDDLKLMVFLEASGVKSYGGIAAHSDNAEIRALLEANGREELAHAHRVSKVIKLLSGEDFPPPADADNPYVPAVSPPLTRALLEGIVKAEHGGENLYESWAQSVNNAEAAALLRQNGKEEIEHGDRAAKALALLG